MPHEFDVVCLGGGVAGEAIAVGLKDSDATDQPSTETGATMSKVEMKLEVVVIPASDVDRVKCFYEGLGWRLDADSPFHFTGPRAQG